MPMVIEAPYLPGVNRKSYYSRTAPTIWNLPLAFIHVFHESDSRPACRPGCLSSVIIVDTELYCHRRV